MSLTSSLNSSSDKNHGNEVSHTSSPTTSSKDVFSTSIEQGDVFLCSEDQNFVNICNGLSPEPGSQSLIYKSDYAHIGNTVHLNVEHANINIQEKTSSQPAENGQVIPQDVTKSPQVQKKFKSFFKDRSTQFWLAGLLMAIMSVTSLILFLSLYKFGGSAPEVPPAGHDDNLGDDIQIIQREEWLARDPLNTTQITHPLKMVRILHSGRPGCFDYQSCSNQVLALQGYHVGIDKLPDIAYNFLIGGDGNVYIGRGADVQNDGRPDAIDIAYVGTYFAPYDKVSDKMDEAGKRLIERLLEKGRITDDYIVVAHNQTEKTLSPGENVYKKIILWPHYDPGNYFQNLNVRVNL